MSWDEIWKIVLAILASVGGIGTIILVIIRFSANFIADRLEKKYTLKLNKELEKYKSNLDNKIYISKTKFDTEFEVYKELSKAFFEAAKKVTTMIPSGYATYPADRDERKKYEEKCYLNATDAVVIAQDTLNSNAPFIQSDLFDKYDEILKLCGIQLSVFEDRWNVYYIAPQEEKESLSTDDYKRSREITDKFKALNTNIREYLAKLDVLD